MRLAASTGTHRLQSGTKRKWQHTNDTVSPTNDVIISFSARKPNSLEYLIHTLCVRRTPTFVPTDGMHFPESLRKIRNRRSPCDWCPRCAAHLRWRFLKDVRINEVVLPVQCKHTTHRSTTNRAEKKMPIKSRNQKTVAFAIFCSGARHANRENGSHPLKVNVNLGSSENSWHKRNRQLRCLRIYLSSDLVTIYYFAFCDIDMQCPVCHLSTSH